MGRYTGPVCRLCRQIGEKLFLKGDKCYTPKCPVERRRRSPGMHIARRRKLSDYGLRLREKQKAKYLYGLLERQFRKYVETARRQKGETGQALLRLLERRLDNVVFRLGFADSRRQARQLVRHGHILVNGKPIDIPSYLVKVGDTVTWRESSRGMPLAQALLQNGPKRTVPAWLSLEREHLTGKVLSLPQPADLDVQIDTRLIVEFYSR
ncbi:MAG: 30S ribosomal protein S4 [Dehalococcoidia bacterium]|nr:30S ribosomal protein S4 [Dehalococcoidia bacterium]MDW8119370.1 30S ribosomal protein S4 [Chloroflexota bacterium]